MRALKQLALRALVPLARCVQRLEGARGVWAHARLAASLTTSLDASVLVLGVPEVHGSGRVVLGRELFLYPELYLETQASGTIAVGDRCLLSRGVHLVSFAAIDIGAGTMIGEYASVRDGNHRVAAGSVRDAGHVARPVRIGRNVWIGRGVAILPGVTIGDDAVVGANAVVTHDIPAGTTAVGVPARPLGGRRAA